MKKVYRLMAIALTVLSVMSVIVPSSTLVYASEISQSNFSKEDVDSLLPIFEALDKIPEELLLDGNNQDINSYFRSQGVYLTVYNDNIGETEDSIYIFTPRADAWRCGLAIGQLLVTVGIPATQLAKIKNYIAALGGAWQAAQLLVGATTVSEKLHGTLVALGGILMTLSGIADIGDYCFG